jgi:hypothetical protein
MLAQVPDDLASHLRPRAYAGVRLPQLKRQLGSLSLVLPRGRCPQEQQADVEHVQIVLRLLLATNCDVAVDGGEGDEGGGTLPLAALDLSGWPLGDPDVHILCQALLRQSTQQQLTTLVLAGTRVTGHAGESCASRPAGRCAAATHRPGGGPAPLLAARSAVLCGTPC